MEYDYIESVDRYYKQSKGAGSKKVKELTFVREILLGRDLSMEDQRAPSCDCCGTVRAYGEFAIKPKDGLMTWRIRKNKSSPIKEYRNNVCYGCLVRLHNYFIEVCHMDQFEALYAVCCYTNNYYDDAYAHAVQADTNKRYRQTSEVVGKDVPWITLYFREVYKQDGNQNKLFWDSENFQFNKILISAKNDSIEKKELFSEEDRNNYNTILNTYHYDPFEEDDVKTRPRLMTYLVTMIDDSMVNDLVRMQSALEIVRAFFRMEDLGRQIRNLQNDGPDGALEHANDIKKLIDMKKKEADIVSQFVKDNGLSEKWATSKQKGSGTMGAIVRDMENAHYDFGTINRYDIETSAAIKQVSDISAESILKQVGLQSSDYADMVKEQAETIRTLTSDLSSAREELRLIKEKGLKQELLEELKEELIAKGLSTEVVDEMIDKEAAHRKKLVKNA